MKNGNSQQTRAATAIMSQEVGYLLCQKIILYEMREGRETAAIEALESSVDARVCMIWRGIRDTDGPTREMGINALKVIQEYRKKYPRAAIPTGLSPEAAEATESLRKEAAEILEKDFTNTKKS